MKLSIKNEKGVSISKGMMGLFFEDINYGADGGLYAEMIENRSFEFLRTTGVNPDMYIPKYDGGYGWYERPEGSPFVGMEYHTENPLTTENPHYLKLTTAKENLGFANKSYDGIFLGAGKSVNVIFYMNKYEYSGKIKIQIKKMNDIFAECTIDCEQIEWNTGTKDTAVYTDERGIEYRVTDAHDGWKKYELILTAPAEIKAAEFTILLSKPGTVDFDFISVIPTDAVYGVFRKDLLQTLKEIHPGFLRFPGGCVIEGNGLANRYQWKLSVGDVTRRKANWNRWSVHDNGDRNNFTSKFPYYNQTLGIGYYEYFLLCEYLGAKALPVVNVGLACQYMSKELVKTDDPHFMDFVNDAIDLIEFANGDKNTKWGSLRAQMGHEEPFGLEFVGIGNEQWETEEVDFFKRYEMFEKAIHEKYPDIKLIGSAGPDVHTPRYEAAWKFYRDNADKKNFAYAIDEHYYMPPEWFLENTHFYDEYPRNVKVFSGEYAAHPRRTAGKSSGNTLFGAVSEAAFLTGVEKNADVVVMSSYAPLLAREGYVQWAPDMVWFNSEIVYGSPSYYVQKMFSNNQGDYTLKTASDFGDEDKVFYSVSYEEKAKETIVKLVNASDKKVTMDIEYPDTISNGKIEMLTGREKDDYNTSTWPDKVTSASKRIEKKDCEHVEMPAYSVCVIKACK